MTSPVSEKLTTDLSSYDRGSGSSSGPLNTDNTSSPESFSDQTRSQDRIEFAPTITSSGPGKTTITIGSQESGKSIYTQPDIDAHAHLHIEGPATIAIATDKATDDIHGGNRRIRDKSTYDVSGDFGYSLQQNVAGGAIVKGKEKAAEGGSSSSSTSWIKHPADETQEIPAGRLPRNQIFAGTRTFSNTGDVTLIEGSQFEHLHLHRERTPSIRKGENGMKHNPYFSGQDKYLKTIENHFNSNIQPALITLCGGPGVGKSAIAHQYASQHAEKYDIFGVIDASSPIKIAQSFQTIGEINFRNFPKDDNPNTNVINNVLSRLNHSKKSIQNILFIVENLDSRNLFINHLSSLQKKATSDKDVRVHAIITTQQNSLAIPGPRIAIENFDNKSAGKCMHDILRDMGRFDISLNECEKLANDVGNSPIATTQAAVYLGNEKGKSVRVFREKYIELYKQAEEENETAEEGNKKDPSVYGTFSMAIERVKKMSPGASALLTYASFFGNERIQTSLFKPIKHSDSGSLRSFRTIDLDPEHDLESVLSTSAKVDSALSALDRFSIIRFDDPKKRDTFSMDRLVQVVAQDSLRGENSAWKEWIVNAAILAFPEEVDHTNIKLIKDIMPYAQDAQKAFNQFPECAEPLGVAHLHYLNAAYHFEMELHQEAEKHIQSAISVYRKASSFASLELERCDQLLNRITLAIFDRELKKANALRGNALEEMDREANTQIDLSMALWRRYMDGDEQETKRKTHLQEAIASQRSVLEALDKLPRERVLIELAIMRNILGLELVQLGKYEAGTTRMKHLEDAVALQYATLKEFPRERLPSQWAATQSCIGLALLKLSQHGTATTHLEESVVAHRAALKVYTHNVNGLHLRGQNIEDFPLKLAETQNQLGLTLLTLGDREEGTTHLEEAIVAFNAALKIYTREEHPLGWAAAQHNLGSALWKLGEREEGTTLLEKSVSAYETALKVHTREGMRLKWETTQKNLDNVLRILEKRRAAGMKDELNFPTA